ncbi:MAG: cytochrome P450, partial [Pseudomonadota bacterium]|nr:cytochrome P450 [Pseudomonadota bacterium]
MTEALYREILDLGPEAAASFDISTLDPAFYENPYPLYHALRRHEPIYRMPSGAWFLTRHADLDFTYHNPILFSSDKTVDFKNTMGETSLYEHHTTSLVFNDPPRHSRVRKRLAPAFTPRALQALESRVVDVVGASLDGVDGMGSFDLLHDYAMKLPIELIGDMLGVPREDRAKLSPWAVAILGGLEADLSTVQRDKAAKAVEEFKDYLRWLISERERKPLADNTGEVLSKLVGRDAQGESLTELELLHNCIFLLNAGHETTANTVTNGIDILLRYPEQMKRLRDEPDLIISTIEEVLRFESSVQLNNRKLTADAEIGGVEMKENDYIWLCIGAANRDPEVFPDPDTPDIGREKNRHLAFGSGIHACAGMSLGRMEARIALLGFVQRFDNIEPSGTAV